MRAIKYFVFVVVTVVLSQAARTANAEVIQQFRVLVNAANVRTSPDVTSLVIAVVPRHTTLELLGRVDGNWLRVVVFDPSGTRRVGYLSARLGREESSPVPPNPPSAPIAAPQSVATPSTVPTTVAADTAAAQPAERTAVAQVAQQVPSPLTAPTSPTAGAPRRLALGGSVGGSTFGVGGTVKYWLTPNLGVDLLFSRFSVGYSNDTHTGIETEAGASVIQLSPAITYRFGEQDQEDDVTVRPYVGGGVSLFRSSLKASVQGYGFRTEESSSSSELGFRGFGGVELFFKKAPRLSVTSDIGYYSVGAPFVGVSIGGLAMGIGVNWYLN